MPRGYPGSTPGVDPGGQGVIPRRFKRKKIFVTRDTGTPGHRDTGWTDRRAGRNSDLDWHPEVDLRVACVCIEQILIQ